VGYFSYVVEGRILDEDVRRAAVRMVERVERLQPKLQPQSFLYLDVLEQAKIEVVVDWPGLETARHVAVRVAKDLGSARSVVDVTYLVLRHRNDVAGV